MRLEKDGLFDSIPSYILFWVKRDIIDSDILLFHQEYYMHKLYGKVPVKDESQCLH